MLHFLSMISTYVPHPNCLSDRIILITGASTGIGAAVAKSYAAHGATVILLARSIKKLEALYDEIEQAGYPTPALYPFNLATASPADYQELATTLQKTFGRLDGLLHNAATLGTLTPIAHYPIERWYEVLQINLSSAFLLTQATLPLLIKSNQASLLFTTANEGIDPKAYFGAYGISKAGIQCLMQTLAEELETNTNIRVNSINPMKVHTLLRRNAYPAEKKAELLSPEGILPLYLYLMGPDSRTIHGKTLTADAIMACV